MKRKDPKIFRGLSFPRLRALEKENDVYIGPPGAQQFREPNQQFGIYDEDGEFVGTIIADDLYFFEVELRKKILNLFFEEE